MEKVEIDMETAEWYFQLANAAYKSSKHSMTEEQKRAAGRKMVALRAAMMSAGFREWQEQRFREGLWDKKVPEIWEQILGLQLPITTGVDWAKAITKEEFLVLLKTQEGR